jgi:ribosomal protein S18 acetylase RimI-like enzyme
MLAMEYLLIQDHTGPHLQFLQELYLSAFPVDERRDWEQLLDMIDNVPEMRLELITDEDKPIGFLISWIFSGYCYIEHFAVSRVNRGKKYGERVIKELMAKGKVLLEAEHPGSADAVRRIGFYERLGMHILPLNYNQPSYRETGKSYPMLLMGNIPEDDEEIPLIISQIKQQVYLLHR